MQIPNGMNKKYLNLIGLVSSIVITIEIIHSSCLQRSFIHLIKKIKLLANVIELSYMNVTLL